MIFRTLFTILLIVLAFGNAEGNENPYLKDTFLDSPNETNATLLTPLGRPFVMRSDPYSKANYLKLREYVKRGFDPRTGVYYDRRGFPLLKSFFDCQLKPSQFSSSYYGKICNEQLLTEIKNNPKLRSLFTERDIKLMENNRNPQGKQWHHDPSKRGRMQLVDSNEHNVDHVGGNKGWGQINERAFIKATAVRWGSVAVFDIAVSSAVMLYTNEFDIDHFAQATTRSVAGGTAAFFTEIIMVKLMPQTIGLPPVWYRSFALLYGGPAAWAGTLSYIAARELVDYCWDNFRLHQLQIQEQACRRAETKARWQRINSEVVVNSNELEKFLSGLEGVNGDL